MRVFASSLLLFGLAVARPAAARDDFLRPTSHDLTAREKASLEERIEELGDSDWRVRQRAIRRLVAIGEPALPALQVVLQRSSESKQLRNACLALGAFGETKALTLLERWVLADRRPEEALRAALFGLAHVRGVPNPEFTTQLRRMIESDPLPTVRETAVLCAGVRRLAGLTALLKVPLQSERSARLRGCMLFALGEAGDAAAAPLVAKFLDPRHARDEKLRRAALQATARLGTPLLLAPLLKFEPDRLEVADYAVALGAYSEPAVVARLGELLRHERERAAVAVHSLARIASPEAKEWLERALGGEFSEAVAAAAALAVADLVDQQRFLPHLRTLALAQSSRPGKADALLVLARIGDREAAGAIADALPLWREPALLERGLLFCAVALDRPIEEVMPQHRRDEVPELWRDAVAIERAVAHPGLIKERIADLLHAGRAHWLLARDDQREAVLRAVLELDRDEPVEQRLPDGGNPSAPPPPSGEGEGAGGGGADEAAPPPAEPRPPDSPFGTQPGGHRRGRHDPTRFEHDLRSWLSDFPPLDRAAPFTR
ncbi:MAG: hypothetical protein FJ293_14470 [Planctomycetes bacterium]|nr:hypothetical protein [Planctomycetota bacterium]